MSKAVPSPDYASELRFGVVMYGGVSLAIYINGVANEMYEMACSTPRQGGAAPPPPDPNKRLDSRDIYERLSWLVGNPQLCATYAKAIGDEAKAPRQEGETPRDMWDAAWTEGLPCTRLVVDVIAGTSAGGINGIFLAKALANGEQFASLKNLWVKEGDIALLLNDKISYQGLGPPPLDRINKPASLLNSDRMYQKLLSAMESMAKVTELARPDGESPLVEEMDLFVTTTDIAGSAVALRLADKVVQERRHKQYYQFSTPEGASGGNDFIPANNPFLAFAARCTSSFPFAFEPMTLATVTRLGKAGDVPGGVRFWDRFFPNLPKQEVTKGEHVTRAFGDGGYLDNKPFTYVVEALSTRQAGVPIERKLVYVEPSPEHLEPPGGEGPKKAPDALSNALAALTSIPQYETIREDLQAVLKRNQRIERIEHIVRLGERDVDEFDAPVPGFSAESGQVSPWSTLKLSDMMTYYGVAFLPYRRLRVFSLTDKLADRLAEQWGVDRDSDHLYALRALVRAWRDRHFDEEAEPQDDKQTINAFLDQFDIDHRIRRIRFLLRKTDQATRLLRRRRSGPLQGAGDADTVSATLSDADRRIIKALKRKAYAIDGELAPDSIDRALAALKLLKLGLLEARTSLQRVERESRKAYRQDHPLAPTDPQQLFEVLNLLLGERPASAGPLLLDTVDQRKVRVLLPEDRLKASLASRTLRESVQIRVGALFQAAGATSPTLLQQALESTVDAMRIKPDPRRPSDDAPEANAVNARAWALLGKPRLTRMSDRDTAVVVEAVVCGAGSAAPTQAEADTLNSVEGAIMRRFLGDYYVRYDSFDQMSFPLYYDTGTGEPSTVDVIRISPEDAPSLIDEAGGQRRKLAGTALFNFGAFLDERWRRNDIMWGRLDGAERLIKALLPMSDEATEAVRNELVSRAHGSILREALVEKGHHNLTGLLCDALTGLPGADAAARLKTLMAELSIGDPVQQSRLSGVLLSLLSEQGLVGYVRDSYDVDRRFEPNSALDSAARAVTITGRVLDGIAAERHADTSLPRWLARVGLLAQGLIAVSLPGTLNHRLFRHGLKLLYAFEVVMLVFAMLFGGAESRNFALTALIVTLTLHLLSLVTGDLMQSKATWGRLIIGATAVVVLLLALAGGMALRNGGLHPVMCGDPGETQFSNKLSAWLCEKPR